MTDFIIFITSTHQLKQFINAAYLSTDPKSEAYEHRYLSINNIMSEVWKYSLVFRDEPISKVANWCSSQRLEFLGSEMKRKDEGLGARSSLRGLYVLKNSYKSK